MVMGERRLENPAVSRGLMASVIIMGVLIVMGTLGLVGTVVWRSMHRSAVVPVRHDSVSAAPLIYSATVTRIAGADEAQIQSVAARPDGTVLVTLRGRAGDELLIWDPAAGRILARLKLTRDPHP